MKRIKWNYGLSTHIGPVKKANEDRSFFRYAQEDNSADVAIAMVADGMGGLQAGDEASEIAIASVKQWWDQQIEQVATQQLSMLDLKKSLEGVFFTINEKLLQLSKEEGIKSGTTLSILFLYNDRFLVFHVGDSRIYKMILDQTEQHPTTHTTPLDESGNVLLIQQLTEDHSWVEQQVKSGQLTKEEARMHPKRNVLSQCLGVNQDVDVYLNEGFYDANTLFLLCSDGFHAMFSDETIATSLRDSLDDSDLQETSDYLVGLANQNGTTDNISVMLLNKETIIKSEKGFRSYISNLINKG